MPKISVHLEADSAEEFLALLGSFKINTSRPVEVPSPTIEQAEASDPVREAAPEPGEVITAPGGPYELAQPGVKIEQPPVEAKEPAQPRRGRPRKEKPAAETAAVADVAAAVADVAAAVADVAEPEPVKPEPAKAKPKAMPHALPENGAATRQDLLDAFSEYVQRYGASFGFSDISQLLQKNLGDGVRKASDVPEDKLPVAIAAIKTAIADNPFNRKRDYA